VVVLSAATLALTGCETSGFNVASDDACAAERTELKSYQDFFFRSMVEGAVAGAVVGGLAGALIGGNTSSALIGAGAGAVAGGVGGYFLAKQKATSDRTVLTQSVYKDVSAENAQIDNVTASFRKLRDCRFRSAEAVKNDFAAGKLSREDAQKKLAKTRDLFQEDITFAESLGAKMNQRGAEYQNASDEMVKLDPSAKQTLAAREAAAGGAASVIYVANEAARVRAEPSTSSKQIAALAPDEAVTPVGAVAGKSTWMHVQLKDGRSGYVASRLLRQEGTAAPVRKVASAAPPPTDVAGVAQLTETNQLKRKALNDDVEQAKVASSSAFELDGKISRVPNGYGPQLQAG